MTNTGIWGPKLKVWGEDIDTGTILQAERTARHPKITGHVALMPDAHIGIGATIGSVIPTQDAIIPSAVGVDIGCGMIAVETTLKSADLPDTMDPLVSQFGRSVPSGVGRGRNLQSKGRSDQWATQTAQTWMRNNPNNLDGKLPETALSQLGTLGSGNHFLEVCLDKKDAVWLVLHSGSRGVGNQLAMRHIKLARAQEQGLEDKDLAYFLRGTAEFLDYIRDMTWAQRYAMQNREIMVTMALQDLFTYVGMGREVGEVSRINCHHNFAALEFHGDRSLWITRKGAIRAKKGDMGVIPGSMATGSYIVRGKGNLDSYTSASHGAGRKMSRGQAKRELTTESLEKVMEGKAWNRNAKALLDEHPDSYKDIDQVMAAQDDLVEIVQVLTQILNYKGV